MASKQDISGGTVHATPPKDLAAALTAHATILAAWQDITPLARNEWICWVEDAKRPETRAKRIKQAQSMLEDGKRRPCCWPGCSHREKSGS